MTGWCWGRTGSPAVPGPAAPGLPRLPRHRVGGAGARRERHLRAADPRGVPVRAVVADHPAQACRLPYGLRGLRPEQVARFGDADRARLMADTGIVRNRLKVEAAITNARAVLGLRDTGGLDALFWSFTPLQHERPADTASVPATSPESVALAKALKRAGFVFVGPTTMYAAMQACGWSTTMSWGATGPVPGDARARARVAAVVPRAACGDGRHHPVRRRRPGAGRLVDGPSVDYFDMTFSGTAAGTAPSPSTAIPRSCRSTPRAGTRRRNPWAFYPLFRWSPGADGTHRARLPGRRLDARAGLRARGGAAHGRAADRRVGSRVALATVAVWAAFPAAVSLQLAYTESLAMLVLCGFLWAVIRQRVDRHAALALVLGLTRPIALPLLAVVAVALFVLAGSGRAARREGEYAAGAGAIVACGVSGLVWPSIAWAVTGSPTAYTDTMAACGPAARSCRSKPWLWMSEWVFRDHALAGSYGPVRLAAVVTVIVVMVCGPWARALGRSCARGVWPTRQPGLVLDPFTSIFRYLLPLFPLLSSSSAGGWLGRPARPAVPVPRTALLVAAGVAGRWRGSSTCSCSCRLGLPAVMSDLLTAGAPQRARREGAAPAGAVPPRHLWPLAGRRARRHARGGDVVPDTRGCGHLEPTVGDIFRLWDSSGTPRSPKAATRCPSVDPTRRG